MRTSAWLLLVASVLFLIVSSFASAQEYPKYELFGGYAYSRLDGRNWHGWHVSGTRNLHHILGIIVEAGQLDASNTQSGGGLLFEEKRKTYTFMAGPQVTSRDAGPLAPFLHLLLGAAHNKYQLSESVNNFSTGYSASDTEFAMALGGGIDFKLKGPLAVRGQLDYVGFRIPPATAGSLPFWNKGFRFSGGLSLRLGKESY